MVLGGLFECIAVVDTVGLEIDDLGAGWFAVVAGVEVDAVEDAVDEAFVLDVAEGAFAPDRAGLFRLGEDRADVGLIEAGLDALPGRFAEGFGEQGLGAEPFDLLEGVVHLCAEAGGSFAEVEEPTRFDRGGCALGGAGEFQAGMAGREVVRGRGGGWRGCRGGPDGSLVEPLRVAGLPEDAAFVGLGSEAFAQEFDEAAALGAAGIGDDVERALGAGHRDIEPAERLEAALAFSLREQSAELGVGLHDVLFQGLEDPFGVTVGVPVGADAPVDREAAGLFLFDEEDDVVFKALGFVDGFDDDGVARVAFAAGAVVEKAVEAVEVAALFRVEAAGGFDQTVEALAVPPVVVGKVGGDAVGGPADGALGTVFEQSGAQAGDRFREGVAGGGVVDQAEGAAGHVVAGVRGQPDHREESDAGGVVGRRAHGGAGVDGYPAVAAKEVGDLVGIVVFANEDADAEAALDGVERLEDFEQALVAAGAFGLVGAEPAGVTGAFLRGLRGGVVLPGALPAPGDVGVEAFFDCGGIVEDRVDRVEDGRRRAP